jgi:hypothetical protein
MLSSGSVLLSQESRSHGRLYCRKGLRSGQKLRPTQRHGPGSTGRPHHRGQNRATAFSGGLLPITPLLLPRLSEQTLLVERLTEENEQRERTITSLKMGIQKQVCGAGGGD